MRALLLVGALACAASPALAARVAPVISPDPMTVSGRFELPRAAGPASGRLKLGAVRLDPTLGARTKQDGHALETAVRGAVERSLQNFGYLAEGDAKGATTVHVELLPLAVERAEDAANVVARVQFTATGENAGCFARVGEGRFKALEREKSGGGRRAFAVGAVIALAFVGVNGGGFLGSELSGASEANKAKNGLRKVAAGEGVAPGFGEHNLLAYGANSATQLALADYIRQLGEEPACGGASPAGDKRDASVTLAPTT